MNNKCNGSVWVACTAQQDLSQVVAGSQIRQTDDAYGKIMGRFTIKVSLSASKPEYITKVRLLEKNGNGEAELIEMYKRKKLRWRHNFSCQLHLMRTTRKPIS